MTDSFNCPNCGGELSRLIASSKMVTCPYCDSTVMLEDDVVRLAGKQGVMAEEPSLFELGRTVEYEGRSFTPIGKARFSYGQGWWDEFWALDGRGEGVWISVDEGDIALEENHPTDAFVDENALTLGMRIRFEGEVFTVTEAGTATCEALRGEFPEEMSLGDSYRYYHLSGSKGRLVTLEFSEGEMSVTEGLWIDPYLVRLQAIRARA